MSRTCSDCGQPLLVKNTAREHFDGKRYTWRCRACEAERKRQLIERTLASYGR